MYDGNEDSIIIQQLLDRIGVDESLPIDPRKLQIHSVGAGQGLAHVEDRMMLHRGRDQSFCRPVPGLGVPDLTVGPAGWAEPFHEHRCQLPGQPTGRRAAASAFGFAAIAAKTAIQMVAHRRWLMGKLKLSL